MLNVLNKLGDVSEDIPLNANGKASKFKGKLTSKVENKNVNFGLLHYPWNRTIGVNKIQQAIQYAENAKLDGAVIVGTKFTISAIEQAYRNNTSSDKRIILLDFDEINAASNNEI